jgi:DNA-directed RNA polymerase specialized sigma24 family protein
MLSVHTLMQEGRVNPKARTGISSLGRKEERRLLAEAIDRLPEVPRLVLSLRYYEAVRPKDIAAVLGLREEEVREILSEACTAVLADMHGSSPAEPAVEADVLPPAPRARKGGRR